MLMFEYLVPSWWNCLGWIGGKELTGGGAALLEVSLRRNFEVSKDQLFPVSVFSASLWLLSQNVSCQ